MGPQDSSRLLRYLRDHQAFDHPGENQLFLGMQPRPPLGSAPKEPISSRGWILSTFWVVRLASPWVLFIKASGVIVDGRLLSVG